MNTSPDGPAPLRIANACLAHHQADESIATLAQQSDLDLLQLDYLWPTNLPLNSSERVSHEAKHAHGLLQQLKSLQMMLFLDPGFVLVTNAGASDPLGCVEVVSRFLCQRGESGLPISAIRGAELMGSLEELTAAGVELTNLETGALFRDLHRPIDSATVHIGAGPLATSLAEGARIIVAGSYHDSAPTLAMGVHHFGWTWSDYDSLAGAAVASRLSQIAHQMVQCSASSESLIVENNSANVSVCHDGSSQLLPPFPNLIAGNKLIARLQQMNDCLSSKNSYSIDVDCDLKQLHVESNPQGGLQVDGAIGQPTDALWPVTLWYESHFVASTFMELTGPDREKQLAAVKATLGSLPHKSTEQACPVRVERMLLENGNDCISPVRSAETIRLHLSWQHQNRQACERLTQTLSIWAGRQNPSQLRLLEPWPTVRLQLAAWPTHVPREMVDIAVDTRTAKQWE